MKNSFNNIKKMDGFKETLPKTSNDLFINLRVNPVTETAEYTTIKDEIQTENPNIRLFP